MRFHSLCTMLVVSQCACLCLFILLHSLSSLCDCVLFRIMFGYTYIQLSDVIVVFDALCISAIVIHTVRIISTSTRSVCCLSQSAYFDCYAKQNSHCSFFRSISLLLDMYDSEYRYEPIVLIHYLFALSLCRLLLFLELD